MTVVLGVFADEARFLRAVERARADDLRIAGDWSPVAVAALTEPRPGRRPILRAGVIGGLGAAALFYLLEWLTAVFAYPFDSGGRQLHSWPAFLVAPVEVGALAAAAAGFVAFLVTGRLTRLHDAAFDIEDLPRASDDRFLLALDCDGEADAHAAIALLADAGAVQAKVIER